MAFSIRNIFQKGEGQAAVARASNSESPFTMYSASPNNGSPPPSPFGPSIFKTRDDEPESGAPIGGWGNHGSNGTNEMSPFSPFGGTPNFALTVEDLLPHLPPEVVRANGASPEQPVSLSASALEAALTSGRMSVPLFEIYRVCPALFQVPVSPQDPRLVPLPQSVIGRPNNGAPPANNPFSASPPPNNLPPAMNGGNSPLASPPIPPSTQQNVPTGAARPAGSLPPRRPPGMPPNLPTQNDVIPSSSPTNAQPPLAAVNPHSAFSPPGSAPLFPSAAVPSPFVQAAQNSPFTPASNSPLSMLGIPSTAPSPLLPQSNGCPPINGIGEGASPFSMSRMNSPAANAGETVVATSQSAENTDPEVGTPSRLLFGTKINRQNPDSASMSPPPGFSQPNQESPSAPTPFNPFSIGAPAQSAAPLFTPPQPDPEVTSMFKGVTSSTVTPLAGFDSPFTPQAPAIQPQQPQLGASFEPISRPSQPFAPTLGTLPSKPLFEPSAEEPRPTFPAFPGPLGSASTASPIQVPTIDELVEIGLATVLKGQLPQDLGFDPNFVPAWITTKLSATDIRRQLPSGRVVFELGQIIDGTEKSFRTVIAHGRRSFQVQIPINEVFHALPQLAGNASGAGAAANQELASRNASAPTNAHPHFKPQSLASTQVSASPESSQGSSLAPTSLQPSFKSGFDPFAPISSTEPPALINQQSSNSVPPPIQPAFKAAFDPFAPSISSPQQAADPHSPFASFSPPPKAEVSLNTPSSLFAAPANAPAHSSHGPLSGSFLSSLPELPVTPTQSPSSRSLLPPPPPLAPAKPLFQSPSSSLADVPATSLTDPSPLSFASPFTSQKEGSSNPATSDPSKQPSFPSISFGTEPGNPDQMLLRALLGTSDTLTLERIVQLTSELPGVLACTLVRGSQVIARGRATSAVKDFENQAATLAKNLKPLAALIGIQGAETFSITTDERLITFSFQDAASLGILHEGRESQTGLRDKITLISREIARMA